MFRAQAVSPYSWWAAMRPNAYRVVVVSDQRIVVCKAGAFRQTLMRRLGRQFHDEVVKADYELFTSP